MSQPKTILFVPCGGMWNALTTACLFSLGVQPDQFDEIIGCSSGVPSLAYWMTGQYQEVREAWINRMTHFRVFHWFKLVFLFSLFRRWGLYAANVHYLIDHCCKDLDRPAVCVLQKLWAILYDVAAARTELLSLDESNFTTGLKASAAIPGLAPRIMIDDREKVDGGTANPLPIELLLQHGGPSCRIVIMLNHARDYCPSAVKPWRARCAFPDPREIAAHNAILSRHEQHARSMELLEQLEREGRVYIVAPEYSPLMHGLSRRRQPVRMAWEYGHVLGQVHCDQVRQFLGQPL